MIGFSWVQCGYFRDSHKVMRQNGKIKSAFCTFWCIQTFRNISPFSPLISILKCTSVSPPSFLILKVVCTKFLELESQETMEILISTRGWCFQYFPTSTPTHYFLFFCPWLKFIWNAAAHSFFLQYLYWNF